jgi:hypothetical protein
MSKHRITGSFGGIPIDLLIETADEPDVAQTVASAERSRGEPHPASQWSLEDMPKLCALAHPGVWRIWEEAAKRENYPTDELMDVLGLSVRSFAATFRSIPRLLKYFPGKGKPYATQGRLFVLTPALAEFIREHRRELPAVT